MGIQGQAFPAQKPRVVAQTLEVPMPFSQGCAPGLPSQGATGAGIPLPLHRSHPSFVRKVAGQMEPVRRQEPRPHVAKHSKLLEETGNLKQYVNIQILKYW